MRNVFFPLSTLVFFSLLAFDGVFLTFSLLPPFRIEVWPINLYIGRQGWNLVRLGVSRVSIFRAELDLYGALMGGGARCWVGGRDIELFHLPYIYLFGGWHLLV